MAQVDYTVPSIREVDLQEAHTMAGVEAIRVFSPTDNSEWIAKDNFNLPIGQIIGPVGPLTSQVTLENGRYYINI